MYNLINNLKNELLVLIVSATPVIELRGAIPLGVSLGLSLKKSILISLVGNMLVVPIIFLIFQPVIELLEKTDFFLKILNWVRERTIRRSRKLIKKYSTIGLFFLVALPLPTTGAWTASMAAMFLRLDKKKAIISICLGLVMSAAIVSIVTYDLIF